jgi:hypothetical protein
MIPISINFVPQGPDELTWTAGHTFQPAVMMGQYKSLYFWPTLETIWNGLEGPTSNTVTKKRYKAKLMGALIPEASSTGGRISSILPIVGTDVGGISYWTN